MMCTGLLKIDNEPMPSLLSHWFMLSNVYEYSWLGLYLSDKIPDGIVEMLIMRERSYSLEILF